MTALDVSTFITIMDTMNTRRHGSELLREWRGNRQISQAAAATLIGILQGSLSNYEKGKATPGASNAVRVQQATGGAVPVESWLREASPAAREEPPARPSQRAPTRPARALKRRARRPTDVAR
jgi:transcriptional regulator with XRE-family HTH domain